MGDSRHPPGAVPAVAIIGCGRIGSALDEQQPPGSDIALSHAGACEALDRVRLAALCDPDPDRLAAAGARRGVTALYDDPVALFATERVDVVAICSPTQVRLSVVEAALDAGVRALVIEKPLGTDLGEAEAVAALVRQAGAVASVNYIRRHCPGLIATADRLRQGEIGDIQHAVIQYGKGLNNNGSHAIDLVRWWLGEPVGVRAGHPVDDDMAEHDPTLTCHLDVRMGDRLVPVHLVPSDHRAVSLFEVDVLGTRGRVRATERGEHIDLFQVSDDPTFPGYTALTHSERLQGGATAAVRHLWEDLLAVLDGQRPRPACTVEDGCAALRVVEAAREAATKGGVIAIAPNPSTTGALS